jgi:hypothetical protein
MKTTSRMNSPEGNDLTVPKVYRVDREWSRSTGDERAATVADMRPLKQTVSGGRGTPSAAGQRWTVKNNFRTSEALETRDVCLAQHGSHYLGRTLAAVQK